MVMSKMTLVVAGCGLFVVSFGLTWWWLDRTLDAAP